MVVSVCAHVYVYLLQTCQSRRRDAVFDFEPGTDVVASSWFIAVDYYAALGVDVMLQCTGS